MIDGVAKILQINQLLRKLEHWFEYPVPMIRFDIRKMALINPTGQLDYLQSFEYLIRVT